MEGLKTSLEQYNTQLSMVREALSAVSEENERVSLLELQSELQQLIELTQESLDALTPKEELSQDDDKQEKSELDDEYALFMQEMAKSGAYTDEEKPETSTGTSQQEDNDSDIEDELATLLGMKCAVYHTYKWGGQPTLHNAMVSAVVPPKDEDQFKDLQVRVLFTHPTHAEMLPCPYFLDGECKFSDEQCRYSHGAIVQLSGLKEAIEPNFGLLKVGSRILLKLKPPDDEDITTTKKSTEKYHLWHSAVVKSVDIDNKMCVAKLEQGAKTGDKRKTGSDEFHVPIEDIFPLNSTADDDDESDSEGSLSDTEYPESKNMRSNEHGSALLIEKSLETNAPPMGEWERHTRGMGSKLMLAMGYVPGSGLGAEGAGRLEPVEARRLPAGRNLDHCMAIEEKLKAQDPLKVEQKLKRLQKKEEERNKRAYEREKERERRNVFNFLNKTLGNKEDEGTPVVAQTVDVKQSTSKDLNIEQFKITEDTRKLERDIIKLNTSLSKYPAGSPGHRSINMQIVEKNQELSMLQNREQQISREQKQRKEKQKMTVF